MDGDHDGGQGTTRADLGYFFLIDDPQQAAHHIIKFHNDRFLPVGERRKASHPPEEPPTL